MTITVNYTDGTTERMERGLIGYGAEENEDGTMVCRFHMLDDIGASELFMLLSLLDASLGERSGLLDDALATWLNNRERIQKVVAESMTKRVTEEGMINE